MKLTQAFYLLIALALPLGIFVSVAWANTKEAGEIVLMRGEVFILDSQSRVVADPEAKRGRSSTAGSKFYEGERVTTKSSGRVKLKFNEGHEVVLGADSSLLIEESSNQGGRSLELARGEIRSSIQKGSRVPSAEAEVFQVKTPNAVAGVRGTVFTVRYNDQTSSTDVATERGAVMVSSRSSGAPRGPQSASQSQLVSAGMFTSAAGSSGQMSPPRPIAEHPDLSNRIQELSGAPETFEAADNTESISSNTAANSAPLSREPVEENTGSDNQQRSPASSAPETLLMDESTASSTPTSIQQQRAPQNFIPEIPRAAQEATRLRNNTRQTQSNKGQVKIKLPQPTQ